jgi:FkbM family methyltransferase
MNKLSALRRRVEPLLPIRAAEATMHWAMLSPPVRAAVNRFYNALDWRQKHYFWRLFAGAFVDRDAGAIGANWEVVFNERSIVLPLTTERLWLDWLLAVSLLGQDAEVKQTYASILKSKRRPDLFVDVGANYGQNSILFLVHGIRTISFEPNPVCHEYFAQIAHLNQVKPDIRNLAVGDSHRPLRILFADGKPWNGSADPSTQNRLRASAGNVLREFSVEQTTLDDILASQTTEHTLIKIDTEGFEEQVLRGARNVLASRKATIIFEAWPEPSARTPLYELLAGERYDVFALPWTGQSCRSLSLQAFETAIGMNFLALPAERASS